MHVTDGFMLAMGVGVASVVGGCGPQPFATDADVLRERVLDLETQVVNLQRRNRELRLELRQFRTMVELPEYAPENIREFLPHVAEISIRRLSHVRDTTGDGRPDMLIVYIHSIDGMGRFTQMVGDVLVNAVIVPSDDDARTIGRVQFGPGEVRGAYRSGLTGTHYTFEVPLEISEAVDQSWLEAQRVTVRVTYISGVTGQSHTAERSIALLR